MKIKGSILCLLLGSLLSTVINFASADTVTSQTHPSLYVGGTQCDGGTFDQVMYAGSSKHEMIDTFTEANTSYVWQFNTQNTYISVYNAFSNAISVPTLSYFSNGKPHNVTTVVVMGTKEGATIASSVPSTYKRSDVAAQVVYHVTRTRFLYKEGTAQTMKYLDHNDLSAGTETYKYMTNGGRLTKSDNECLNIHIGFCGDGILDNGSSTFSDTINASLKGGEECDDGSSNGTSSSNCSSTCKIKPKCGSANGTTRESKPSTSAEKCEKGTAGTVTEEDGKYKWKCSRSGLEVDCEATKKVPDKASCGTADGGEYERTPTSNLCGDGTASKVSEEGTTKYTWTCTKGSDVVTCEAKRAQPKCGSANGTTRESKPSTSAEKCEKGTAGTVTEEDGKYKWKCSRSGLEIDCEATKKVPDKASCGTADGGEYESTPTSNLCGDGTASKVSEEGTTKYTWTCTKGSDVVTCEAKRAQPKCGSANGTTRESKPSTSAEKCEKGTAGTVTEENGKYKWKCSRSGLEVDCEATKKVPDKAKCGTADGKERESAPSTDAEKCGDGTSSNITTTKEKYTWTCTKGSDVVTCEAIRLQPKCGSADGTTRESKPSTDAEKCEKGIAGTVTEEDGKYKWKCSRSGLEVDCKATKKAPDKAACGTADGKERESAPSTDTEKCGDGTSSNITTTKEKYTWTCTKGSDVVSCEAIRLQPKCGSADGKTIEKKPSKDSEKCESGTAGTVTEKDGKYKWKCSRSGLEVDCEATKKAPDKASCGDADGGEYESAPTSNLCGDGTASKVSEEGTTKYKWTCTKGSDVKSCEAKRAQPACGVAINNSYESAPTTDLCKAGKSSTVKEENGKYKWTCTRSGIVKDCEATKKEPEKPSYVKIEKKEVLAKKDYEVGEQVGFKITYSNDSQKKIDNVVIRDFIPLNLNFVSAVNSIPSPMRTYKAGNGQLVVEFSGFSVEAGKSGFITITGEILDSNLSNTYNCAISYTEDNVSVSSEQPCDAYNIKKSIGLYKEGKLVDWNTIEYTVTITSKGGDFTGFKVEDYLPEGVSYIIDSRSIIGGKQYVTEENFSNGNGKLVWDLDIKDFKKNSEIVLKYSVRINQNSTKTRYTNKVCVNDGNTDLGCISKDVDRDSATLSIKKEISKSPDGEWGKSVKVSASDKDIIVYFKITVIGKVGEFKKFSIVDDYDTDVFQFVEQPGWIANFYKQGFVKKGGGYYGYSWMTPSEGSIKWDVTMSGDYVFSEGDEYYVIFPLKILSESGGNKACVYAPEKKDCSEEAKFSIGDPCDEPGACPKKPECGNGVQDGIEYCDLGNGGGIVQNGILFSEEPYGTTNSKYNGWKCNEYCELVSGSVVPSCFNVQNGSISIMTGELLPFYWNIEGMLGEQDNNARMIYLKKHFYSHSDAGSDGECNMTNLYKVDLDSLKCDFIVYGPSVGEKVIYKIENVDCVGVNGWGNGSQYYQAIEKYIAQNWSGWFAGSVGTFDGSEKVKNVFETLDNWDKYPILFPVSSKMIISNFGGNGLLYGLNQSISPINPINVFGEYKISLNNVSYDYCDYEFDGKKINYKISSNNNKNRVCEVDFAVTNHYLTQKSPWGTVDAETVNNLNKYYLKNGKSLFTLGSGDEKDDNYQIVLDVPNDFEAFVKKYSRIAEGDNGLRQVVGSMIFVTDVEPGGSSFVVPQSLIDSGKPFTLLSSKGVDIKIPGNISQNIMIITSGSIVFDAEGACNPQSAGTNKYSLAGQLIKGIFYAGNGFTSTGDKYNDNVDNPYWCNYGNLHIKGFVIGDLSKVKNQRRSELYTWFKEISDNPSDGGRDVVIRGASVMVEFNSKLLGDMPPGASEFNKILNMQRK